MKPTAEETHNRFHTISLNRALTEPESRTLERAIKQIDAIGTDPVGPWTSDEDASLMELRRAGKSFDTISRRLRRSKMSCYSRYRRISRGATVDKVLMVVERRQERYWQVVAANDAAVEQGTRYKGRVAKRGNL